MAKKLNDLSPFEGVNEDIVNDKVYVSVGSFMWAGEIFNCEYDKVKKRSFLDIPKAVKQLGLKGDKKQNFLDYVSRISL